MPLTVDRIEKINKYLNSVNLKPFLVDVKELGEDFNPSAVSLDKDTVIKLMKKVALQSSQNLKRNADAFLSTVSHDNDTLLWPGGKRTQSDKFALTY